MGSHKGSPRLSVVMIVRNAEDALTASLDSIAALADEVVVLDTGSTDGTVRIAQKKATRVAHCGWNDSFAQARNAALKNATGEWILWLDAGDTISSETIKDLRNFIDTQAQMDTCYYLIVRTPQQGTDIAGEQAAKMRLHPRVAGLEFSGRVRESLTTAMESLKLKAAGLTYTIERSSRQMQPEIKEARAKRNIYLAQTALKEEGPTPTLLNCLGEATQWLGDIEQSAKYYKQALEASLPGSDDMLEAYYGLLTSLEGVENSREAQLQLCMRALETYPLDAQLLCAIGGYLQARGQVDLASRSYQLAAEHGQIHLPIAHLEGLHDIAFGCYCQSLQMLGREAEAIGNLETELQVNVESLRLRRQLLELYVKHNKREEALAVVNGMPRYISNREALRSAVRGACLAVEGKTEAAKTYLETAYKAGCREPLCLRWLANIYLLGGQLKHAETLLQEWFSLEPYSQEVRQLRSRLQTSHTGDKRTVRVDENPAGVIAPVINSAKVSADTNAWK
jgi:tetratricopeptide (TPR) repeat protein